MMATYFHGGSEIQPQTGGSSTTQEHNLQTLYLMNPNFIAAYSEAAQQSSGNMLFLNPSHALTHQSNIPHAPHNQQQFIGIPLGGSHSEDHGRPSPSSSGSLQHHQIPGGLHGLSVSRVHPNLWGPVGNPSPTQSQPSPVQTTASGPIDMADQMGFRRLVPAQGLSLSLSPGHQQQNNQSHVTVVNGSSNSVAGSSNGVVIGSKYLKPAQELLEEIVNVGGNNYVKFNDNNNNNGENCGGESSGVHKDKDKAKVVVVVTARDQSGLGLGEVPSRGGGECSIGGGSKNNQVVELTTAQRQELQMKKAKLLNMLGEVEQKYRQYNTQMQVVVASFEQAAGTGSAKLYTSLALKTISKQFRSLKDAIMTEIKATSKSLGEEDNKEAVKLEGGAGSRLKFVDNQLRQQRALQQLGMMQHNAWRPQRGLPERAVSVLRAWLFEHFLHPYPKDSDKHMLAKQTGLTRSQVSNWFINARVRLWKPMVEEMYTEEMKTQEQNITNSEENTTTNNKNRNSPKNNPSTTKDTLISQQHKHQQDHESALIQPNHTPSTQGFTLIGSTSDMDSLMARSPKKQRSNSDMNNSPSSILSMDMEMKPIDHTHHHQQHSFLMASQGGDGSNTVGFNPYMVNDIAGQRFNPEPLTTHPYHGNAVSLTLGLPQNFLPNQGENDFCGISMAQPSHPNNGYESIDIQNRKRFVAHQLLHDFVA